MFLKKIGLFHKLYSDKRIGTNFSWGYNESQNKLFIRTIMSSYVKWVKNVIFYFFKFYYILGVRKRRQSYNLTFI